MAVNSRAKGAHGERKAAEYLRELGFPSAIRGQQRSGLEQADVICEELDNVHIEVKYGYDLRSFDLCLDKHERAIHQAVRDAKQREWAVLWKPKGFRYWRLSFAGIPCRCTVSGDSRVKTSLLWLQQGTTAVQSAVADAQAEVIDAAHAELSIAA